MDGTPALKKDWTVNQAAFDRLLAMLDADRDRAGEKYELIRQKLTKFFQWRGCASADDLADRVIDRGARRIEEGAEIHTHDVYLFFHGIAINLLREHWKDVQKHEVKALEDLPDSQRVGAEDPAQTNRAATERESQERKLGCLDGCVRKLPPQQLVLITQYHQGEGGAKIAKRNELARQLGIPLNALRIRAYRIRGELETCVAGCMKSQGL